MNTQNPAVTGARNAERKNSNLSHRGTPQTEFKSHTAKPEAIAADKAALHAYKSTHAAALPDESNPFKVIETTEERYEDMLGAVPPIGFGGSYFLCGEPVSERKCKMTGGIAFTYDAFFASNDYQHYYTVSEPITGAEFKQLIKEVGDFVEANKPLNNVTLCYVD